MEDKFNILVAASVSKIIAGFEDHLIEANVTKIERIPHTDDMWFCTAELRYPEETMTVPFVYTKGSSYVMTPTDWQGQLPQSVSEIRNIDWRINDTERTAMMVNGIPMAFV